MDEYLYNILSISVCLFALTSYALSSYLFTYFFPRSSAKMQMVKTTRSALLWLKKHREKTDSPNTTVAVQTLRNSIFVAIFTGGATFLSAVTLLNSFPSIHDPYQKIRTVILSVILFLSFLSWASVLRSSSHLGYMTGVLKYHEPYEVDQDQGLASHTLSEPSPANNENSNFRGGQVDIDVYCSDYDTLLTMQEQQRMCHERSLMYMLVVSFSLGFRFLFISIPFVLYVAGPEALIISTVGMLMFMLGWDYLYIFVDSSAVEKSY